MNEYDSWKKTEDTEIDLADLLRKLVGKWKQITVCALAGAVLLGGYSWMKNKAGRSVQESAQLENDVLTEEEERTAKTAAVLAGEIGEMEAYLDQSVLMQVDPYHKYREVLLYSVDEASGQSLLGIAECYLNYLNNGGAAETLEQNDNGKWNIDGRYLSELITAWQKTDSTNRMILNDAGTDTPSQALLYIEVTGKDAQMAEKLADSIQDALQKYSAVIKRTCADHRLYQLSRVESVRADMNLRAQQHEMRTMLESDRTSLKAMTDAFNDMQRAVYMKDVSLEEKQDTGQQPSGGMSRLYILFGLLAGIFAYCGVYACWYMLSDVIKSTGEFKIYYTVPFYGSILAGKGRKSADYEKEGERTAKRIRFACQKHGVQKLCLAVNFEPDGLEQECLKKMARQLQNWGIETNIQIHMAENVLDLDALAKTGTVLVMCKIGSTTRRNIDEEMEFYQENGMTVIGAAALEMQ